MQAIHKEDGPRVIDSVMNMFNTQQRQVVFTPYASAAKYTDPSYHLPAFYTVWAVEANGDHHRPACRRLALLSLGCALFTAMVVAAASQSLKGSGRAARWRRDHSSSARSTRPPPSVRTPPTTVGCRLFMACCSGSLAVAWLLAWSS